MTAFHNVDLSTKPGKGYWNAHPGERQEEFIYFLLAGVIRGKTAPGEFIKHYDVLQRSVLNEGKDGGLMVTCIDDHYPAGGDIRQWLSFNACPKQVVAGMGFLLSAMGTPSLYYGIEPGFEGNNNRDQKAMFNPVDGPVNMVNQHSYPFSEVAAIAALRKKEAALRFGAMYFRQTSAERRDFHFSDSPQGVLAFSRLFFNEEVLVVYNTAVADAKEEYVLVDPVINKDKQQMRYIYGRHCGVDIELVQGGDSSSRCIKLYLEPKQLVILKSC